MSENTSIKKQNRKPMKKLLLVLAIVALWAGMAVFLLGMMTRTTEDPASAKVRTDLTADFEHMLAKKMEGLGQIDQESVVFVPVKRDYFLSDLDMVAPKPNPACYGTAENPAELAAILQQAQELLDGQETMFTTDTVIMEGSQITYYLDETIFVVTWKQVVGGCVYTISEAKVAHASQFRRFLADGKYGATHVYTTQEMANSVNAVVASSGDFYGYRAVGVCVNQGQVYRASGRHLDTCFVDENGDLIFVRRGQITDKEKARQFVEENEIRFSLSFGPVMIQDGEYAVPSNYYVGEINEPYARAALCQLGSLHYAVVTANYERPYHEVHKVSRFARNLLEMGVVNAYALDGGQTAAIVMNDRLINNVSYGAQREISDIIYFATAIPEDDWQ